MFLTVEDEVTLTVALVAVAADSAQPTPVDKPQAAFPLTDVGLSAVPRDYRSRFVHYATVTRPDAARQIYVSREAIAAVRAGHDLPQGHSSPWKSTSMDMLIREKRAGVMTSTVTLPASLRNADWH